MKEYWQPLLLREDGRLRTIVIAAIATLCALSSVEARSTITQLRSDAELQALSQSATWITLLHYEKSTALSLSLKSSINSDEFFLAKDGNTDALSELIATLHAFSEKAKEGESHARCRFPARYLWLNQSLAHRSDLLPYLPEIPECREFKKWSLNGEIQSISVVFATGYLGNPASYYGHTLLKFNGRQTSSGSTLLDNTTNFGALVPQGENPAVYIVKGIFGGYQSNFTHRQYYYHDHNYTSLESRDLWEYQLNLTKYEKDLLVAHSWELLGKNYTYYFFRENCAYRMAEVLELIQGVRVIPPHRPWTIPTSVIQNLLSIERDGEPLIADVSYHPSNLSEFHQQHEALSDVEKELLTAIINDHQLLEDAAFVDLDGTRKARVLDALLKYSFYRKKSVGNKASAIHMLYQAALSERFTLSVNDLPQAHEPQQRIRDDRNPGRIGLSVLHSGTFDDGIALAIRPAYYDSLDAGVGQAEHSSLSMLEAQLTFLDNKVSVRQLDLLSIDSVKTNVSGLPGDDGSTWSFSAGFKSPSFNCQRCSRFGIDASKGISWRTFGVGVSGIAVTGSIRDKIHGYSHLSAGVEAFGSYRMSPDIRVRWRLGNQHYFASGYSDRLTATIESRLRLTRNTDLRLSVSKNQSTELRFSLGAYW